jgi:phosphatidate phosphatase APP1
MLQMFGSQESYKARTIEALFERFPARCFVLVGDSGENDPEIYGQLARRHPKQVRRVFIRNVTAEDQQAPRYGTAFRGVDSAVWTIFEDAVTLTNRITFPVDRPPAAP